MARLMADDQSSGGTNENTHRCNTSFEQYVEVVGGSPPVHQPQPAMLSTSWASTPTFDLELKRYQLLAFLQRVQRGFDANKVYPYLAELRSRLEDVISLQRSREASKQLREGRLLGCDVRRGRLVKELIPDPTQLEVVDTLVAMALPELLHHAGAGEDLRNGLLAGLQLTPVGLQPMYHHEGWILLRDGCEARVYSYSIPWVVNTAKFDPAMQVRTRYVTSYTWGPLKHLEDHRQKLNSLGSTTTWLAAYALESERPLPRMETLLPLGRHLLFQRIAPVTGPDGRTRPSATEGYPSH